MEYLESVPIYVYKMIGGGAVTEKLSNGGDGKDEEETSASNHWLLPTREYDGLWESLYFEEGLKEKVHQHIYFCSVDFLLSYFLSFLYV